jgi:hypothetical protein
VGKAPEPPKPPDPYATAQAQTASNLTTAIGQAILQNADEESPIATVHYDPNYSSFTIQDPQYDSSGNQVGTTSRVVPVFKRTVSYKPTVQAIFDKNLEVSGKLNQFAASQADTLNTVLGTVFTLASLPPHGSTPEVQPLLTTLADAGAIVSSIGDLDLTTHFNAVKTALLSRPEFQFNVERTNRVTLLRNMGIVPGMEAYDNELRMFDYRWTDLHLKAEIDTQAEQTRIIQLQAVIARFANDAQMQKNQQLITRAGFVNQSLLMKFEMLRTIADFVETFRARSLQEQLAARNQPLNEMATLLHGGQVQQPQFEGFRPGKLEGTPIGQYVYQSAALEMQNYQIKAQQHSQMMGGLMGLGGNLLGGLFAMSDRRTKTDIARLWRDPRGFVWSSWRYVWDRPGTRRFGVIAQEVAHIEGAVVRLPSGLLAVNYGALV